MSDVCKPRQIQVEDHSVAHQKLKDVLELDPASTAFVTIDMHRGHLDMVNATMPAFPDESDRVLEGARDILRFARAHGMPVFHVVLTMRLQEDARGINPRHKAADGVTFSSNMFRTEAIKRGDRHNIVGSIQTELMPQLEVAETDYVLRNKKTLSVFLGTELELLLQRYGIRTLVLMGINTNTCVQCAAFDSFNRAYQTIMLSDCVSSMYGDDLHQFGLENVARCLGWVLTNDELKNKVLSAEQQGRKARVA